MLVFLTVKQEYTLLIFDITVLRRIFGPKREDVTEG
jgi:hypothetical protein